MAAAARPAGPSPSGDRFLEIASIAQRGYFKNEGHGLHPKDEFGAPKGKPPVAEAIRFILDDGEKLDAALLGDKSLTEPDNSHAFLRPTLRPLTGAELPAVVQRAHIEAIDPS